jgi:hypothetical protein
MKNKHFLAIGIMMLMPLTIQAQGNIKRAFNALTTSATAKVESTHKLNKDPETGIKEGQLDVYEFTIPASHHDLIDDIKRAFDQDKEKAYSLNWASTPDKKQYNYERLAVGGGSGYQLGDIKGSRYIYALFLDPDDKSKTHRYAYALEWREGSKEIEGKLVITYATTSKYRQKKSSKYIINGNEITLGEGGIQSEMTAEAWLGQFNTLKGFLLKKSEGPAANSFATQIYKLCKTPKALEKEERQFVIKELEKLKEKVQDEFIQQLFDMSIRRLKE